MRCLLFLWGGNSCRYWVYEVCSEPWPYMLQGNLISKPSEVHTRGEGEKGRVWCQNVPAKAAGHFSQLLDAKLPWGSEALIMLCLGWGTASPNLKFAKFKNTVFWPKSPNLMPTIQYTVYRVCTVTHQTQSIDSCLYYNWRELETAQEGDNLICR